MLIKLDVVNVKHLASQHAKLPAQLQIKSVKESNSTGDHRFGVLI